MHSFSRKERRTLRPSQILPKWHSIRQKNKQLQQNIKKQTEELSVDPLRFLDRVMGFKPYDYQNEFARMFENNQFVAARWCRQSGKTYIVCALLLWYATTHPNSAIGIVGPSWRQTKRILSRIAAFTHNLPWVSRLSLKKHKSALPTEAA